MATCFEKITLERYTDALVVPDPEPLMDYARSTERLDDSQLDRLEQILRAELASGGPIRIQKASGLFKAGM